MTQATFADLAGCTPNAVHRWCSGHRAVPSWAWALVMALEFFPQSSLLEIPDMAWFEVLGVADDCTLAEARVARNRLAKLYHPDLGARIDSRIMRRVNHAYAHAEVHQAQAGEPASECDDNEVVQA